MKKCQHTEEALKKGSRLGPYEIQQTLGQGGMGEVYRARDTRLDRTVAMKVLRSGVCASEQERQRFEREARAVSSLSHPHICVVHDVGRENGIDYLVMEYLEGETLTEKLARGAIPVQSALHYSIQIADALALAHRQGVIHRDLKPGNIMITKSGVKLLDFGLAKMHQAAAGAEANPLLTMPLALTAEGTVVGTLQYMSPEQAEGKEADARSDIFSLGTLIYEMVTGRKAFDGSSAASVLGKILETDPPPVSALQPLAPLSLDRLVRNCLEKAPDQRWQTAHDVKLELQSISEASTGPGGLFIPAARPGRPDALKLALLATILLLGLGAALLAVFPYFSQAVEEPAMMRFSFEPPANFVLAAWNEPVISPDGRHIAFSVGIPGADPVIWIRPIESSSARPLPGTEGAHGLFWSPDSGSIAYYSFRDQQLKRVDVKGGLVRSISAIQELPVIGGSWGAEDILLFKPASYGPLYQVAARGGQAEALTVLNQARGEREHFWPQFLSDNRRFMFSILSDQPENSGLYVASIDSPHERTRITPEMGRAHYASPGFLLFSRQNTLLAQRFDAKRLRISGDPVPLVGGVDFWGVPAGGMGSFSVSQNGILVYLPAIDSDTQLVWVDRTGSRQGEVGEPARYGQIALSPDERRLAVELQDDGGASDIWVIDLARGITSRITFDPASDMDPVWSPDGREIVFSSSRSGKKDLFRKRVGGHEAEMLVLESQDDKVPESWSRDGRFLLYLSGPVSKRAFWALPMTAEASAAPLEIMRGDFMLDECQISPDGEWIAYVSNVSGQAEVYIEPFRAPGERIQVSPSGGGQPKWRADGRELFYAKSDGTIMAAAAIQAREHLEVGLPQPLFKMGPALPDYDDYAPSLDGQRFLIKVPVNEATTNIQLVINWTSLLR
jgi:eukaryotic-like serine/threonine-protein kinase